MGTVELIVLIIALLAIAFGVGECFYGFRIFNFMLRVLGFMFGGGFMWYLGSLIDPWVGALAGLLGAVVGVLLAVPLHCVGVFLMGASMGTTLSGIGLTVLGMSEAWLLTIPFAIVGGILAVWLRRPVIIISTAIVGTTMIELGAVVIVALIRSGFGESPEMDTVLATVSGIFGLLAWLVIAISGMTFQFRDNASGNKAPRRRPEKNLQNTVLG